MNECNTPIKLMVTNTATYVEGEVDRDVYDGLRRELGYIPDDAYFRIQYVQQKTKQKWDGHISLVHRNKRYCRCYLKKDGIHFPTGLYSKAISFLKRFSIPYQTVDKRKSVKPNLSLEMSKDFEFRDYQQGIIHKAANQERGILKAATGSGKTAIAAGLIKEFGVAPFIFYVPSIDLMKQTQDEFQKFLLCDGSPVEIGTIGGGVYDPKDITIMTIQTAVRACGEKYIKYDDEEKKSDKDLLEDKRKDILDLVMSAKGTIIDECQHVSSPTCQTISDYSVSARYRYGMSATPFRDQNDDILIDACFGKQIADVSASFLINQGYLVKPNIYFVDVKAPCEKQHAYQAIYKKCIVENQTRNGYIANIAQKMYGSDKTVLVLVKQIAHGKILQSMIPDSVFLHGMHSGKKRKAHLDLMRNKEAPVTIASVIFDEGVDCRPLDTLILAGSGKSPTRALQRVGRTLRPYTSPSGEKKESATIIDFTDHYKYLHAHSKKRKSIYKTESAFEISDLEV